MIDKLIAEAKEQATWDIPESTQQLLLRLAEVAEKQVAKRPIKTKGKNSKYDVVVCPRCEQLLGLDNKWARDFVYCYGCGQNLDWSDCE